MSKKHFIVRTNSLVAKEGINTLLSFDSDNEVDIPFPVLDELEKLTHQHNQKAKNAKAILDYLSTWNIGKIMSEKGVIQKNGSVLRLVSGFEDEKIPLKNLSYLDLRCLQIAQGLKKEKHTVILVTKNPALRIKANSIGIKAQNFRDDIFPSLNEQYEGRIKCHTSEVKLNDFYQKKIMITKDIYDYTSIEWRPNLFLEIECYGSVGKQSAIARYDGKNIIEFHNSTKHPYGISAQNSGQQMMLESLIESSESAPIVIIKGGAGTGKTYVSLAVALEQIEQNNYSQILVSTPIETVGQEEIGFLPGNVEEKFNPHLGGIRDNLRQLLNNEKGSKAKSKKDINSLFNSGKIQIQPIGFLRGRTIVNTYFIIDETQNISPDDIKSIVTRAGKGSKFVFLGDPTQIDNPQLNEKYNGLVYLSEKMKNEPLAWQVSLNDNESVRSELAKIVAKIL